MRLRTVCRLARSQWLLPAACVALLLGLLIFSSDDAGAQGGPTKFIGVFDHVNHWKCGSGTCYTKSGQTATTTTSRCTIKDAASEEEAAQDGCGHNKADAGTGDWRFVSHHGETVEAPFWFCDSNGNGDFDEGSEYKVASQAGSCSLRVSDASVTEGGVLRFSLSGLNSGENVTYRITHGSTSNSDFSGARSGTVSAGPIQIATADDSIDENTETFTLTVTSTSGSARSDTATGTIRDNDQAGGIQLSAAPEQVREKTGTRTVTVTAAFPAGSSVSSEVNVSVSIRDGTARSSSDYRADPDSFQITIPAGRRSGSSAFSLRITDDSTVEGNETIRVDGSASGYSVSGTVVTIVDDESSDIYLEFGACPDMSWEEGESVDVQLPFARAVNRPTNAVITYDVLQAHLPPGVSLSGRSLTGRAGLPDGEMEYEGGIEYRANLQWRRSGAIITDEIIWCDIYVTGDPQWFGGCNMTVVAGEEFRTEEFWFGGPDGTRLGDRYFGHHYNLSSSYYTPSVDAFKHVGGPPLREYRGRYGSWELTRSKMRFEGRFDQPGIYWTRVQPYRIERLGSGWDANPVGRTRKTCYFTVTTPRIRVEDAADVVEGDSGRRRMVFPVAVPAGAQTGTLYFDFGGTAEWGVDYVVDTGTATGWHCPPYSGSAPPPEWRNACPPRRWRIPISTPGADTEIAVWVTGDSIVEGDETVTVSTPYLRPLADPGPASGVIVNDDEEPEPPDEGLACSGNIAPGRLSEIGGLVWWETRIPRKAGEEPALPSPPGETGFLALAADWRFRNTPPPVWPMWETDAVADMAWNDSAGCKWVATHVAPQMRQRYMFGDADDQTAVAAARPQLAAIWNNLSSADRDYSEWLQKQWWRFRGLEHDAAIGVTCNIYEDGAPADPPADQSRDCVFGVPHSGVFTWTTRIRYGVELPAADTSCTLQYEGPDDPAEAYRFLTYGGLCWMDVIVHEGTGWFQRATDYLQHFSWADQGGDPADFPTLTGSRNPDGSWEVQHEQDNPPASP